MQPAAPSRPSYAWGLGAAAILLAILAGVLRTGFALAPGPGQDTMLWAAILGMLAWVAAGLALAEPARVRRDRWWPIVAALLLVLPLLVLAREAVPAWLFTLARLASVAGMGLGIARSARARGERVPLLAVGLAAAYLAAYLTLQWAWPTVLTPTDAIRWTLAGVALGVALALTLLAAIPRRGGAQSGLRYGGAVLSLAGLAAGLAAMAYLSARPSLDALLPAFAVSSAGSSLAGLGTAFLGLAGGVEAPAPAPS